jgi:LPS-assembly lipoprotein
MSSLDRMESKIVARTAVTRILFVLAGLALAGCTVQPLYYAGSVTVTGQPLAGGELPILSQVVVDAPLTRQEQEVRNHLLFLMGGGAGQTQTPLYSLKLGVTSTSGNAIAVQVQLDEEPTAGVVVMTANYVLTELATGKVIASGKPAINAPYDIPRQEYAAFRAVRDAENRAARELAELVRLSVAQKLSRPRRG